MIALDDFTWCDVPSQHRDGLPYCGYTFYLQSSGLWLDPGMSTWDLADLPNTVFGLPVAPVAGGRFFGMTPVARLDPTDGAPLPQVCEATEEIVAYRAWDLYHRILPDGTIDLLLESLSFPLQWEGPVGTADLVPTAEGRHGIHAVGLTARHEHNFCDYLYSSDIWGRVGLSGRVVEGETGYRAERATIQELWINPRQLDKDHSAEGLVTLLGARYQCEVSVRAPDWTDMQEASKGR